MSEAKADQEESVEIDKTEFLMSAEAVHGRALELLESVKASREGTVYLMAYSFDRKDIGEALIGLVGLPKVKLTMLVDNRQTLKGPKEQLSVLQELVSRGVAVRLLSGKGLTDEYKAAGRSAKIGGLIGIQHSKLLFVRTGSKTHVLIGSANWTTSSRCNVEISSHLISESKSEPMVSLESQLAQLTRQAIELTHAETLHAQRARSQSPGR